MIYEVILFSFDILQDIYVEISENEGNFQKFNRKL